MNILKNGSPPLPILCNFYDMISRFFWFGWGKSISQPNTPQHTHNSTSQAHSLDLDILDLSKAIDVYAEFQAIENYEAMMRQPQKWGMFSKVWGFMKRSFLRMGREAWIDTEKRQMIKKYQSDLKSGNLSSETLQEIITQGKKSIDQKTYLEHEVTHLQTEISQDFQQLINQWLETPKDQEKQRKQKLKEIQLLLEKNYPVMSELSQLESALLRIEKAKIEWELDTIEAKINLFDLGRIEHGYGEKQTSYVVNILQNVDKLSLPKWLKWFFSHPNTMAIAAALCTKWGISLTAGVMAAWVSWGVLAPVAFGAAAWWVFAASRAAKEIKDRNAQIDRRSALGAQTWEKTTDGASFDSLTHPKEYQYSLQDLYHILTSTTDQYLCWETAVQFLCAHKIKRELGLNLLSYDREGTSISSQDVEMVQAIRKMFPNLVADFNSGKLFSQDWAEGRLTMKIYERIYQKAQNTLKTREENEKKYSYKEGIKYSVVAGIVWGTLSSVVDILSAHPSSSIENSIETVWEMHQDGAISENIFQDVGSDTLSSDPTTTTYYPDHLQAYEGVQRGIWYDNATSFADSTELLLQKNHTDTLSVAQLLWKTPSYGWWHLDAITADDFTSWKIAAVITPQKWGPSFVLHIDANGTIEIPESMREAVNQKSYQWIEIWKVDVSDTTLHIDPIMTVTGKGNMVFESITQTVQKIAEVGNIAPQEVYEFQDIPLDIAETSEINTTSSLFWGIGVPFWLNRYHHLGEMQQLSHRLGWEEIAKEDDEIPQIPFSEDPNIHITEMFADGTWNGIFHHPDGYILEWHFNQQKECLSGKKTTKTTIETGSFEKNMLHWKGKKIYTDGGELQEEDGEFQHWVFVSGTKTSLSMIEIWNFQNGLLEGEDAERFYLKEGRVKKEYGNFIAWVLKQWTKILSVGEKDPQTGYVTQKEVWTFDEEGILAEGIRDLVQGVKLIGMFDGNIFTGKKIFPKWEKLNYEEGRFENYLLDGKNGKRVSPTWVEVIWEFTQGKLLNWEALRPDRTQMFLYKNGVKVDVVKEEKKQESSEAEKQESIEELLKLYRKVRNAERQFTQYDFFDTFDDRTDDEPKAKKLLRQMMQFYHPDKASSEEHQRYEAITKELSVVKTKAKNDGIPIIIGLKNIDANFQDFIEYYQKSTQ